MTGERSYTTKIWRPPSLIGFSSADALSTSMDPPGEPVISTWKRPCQKIQNGSEFPELVAQNSRNPQLLPGTGLKSAGFDRCAISSFASRPGKKSCSPQSSLSCSYIGQHGRPIGFILREHGPGYAASLLANATAATLRCVRDVSCASQALRPEDCFVRCCRTARAPCTNSLRK